MHIYEIYNDSNDLTVGQQGRTGFWTQWVKVRVG